MRARHGIVILMLLLAAAVASTAIAAPFKTAALSAATPKFEWTGSGSGSPANAVAQTSCTAVSECQDILLNLEEPGDLTVTIDSAAATGVPDPVFGGNFATTQDIDMYVYKSDDKGTISGADISKAAGATASDPEVVKLPDLAAGFYVVRLKFFLAANAAYTGVATFVSDAPKPVPTQTPAAEPTPQPTATPAPTAEPAPQEPAPQQQAAPAPQQSQAAPAPAPAAQKKPKFLTKKACQKAARKLKGPKRAAALKKCAKIKKS